MKMKKVVILGGVIVTLIINLTGCGVNENEVKKIDKEVDLASINYLENTNEKSREKGNQIIVNDNENKKKNGVDEVKNSETIAEKATYDIKDDEFVDVQYIVMTSENGTYIVVFGYGRNAQKKWEYKTKPDTIGAQVSSVGFIAHDVNSESVIIYELNTIKALDDKTGKVKWTFEGFDGIGAQGITDESGNIYLYSNGNKKLHVLDKNGKLKKKLDMYQITSKEEDLPTLHDGVREMYLDDEKKINLVYDTTIDTQLADGSTISKEYSKKMIIDVNNAQVKIETIDVKTTTY